MTVSATTQGLKPGVCLSTARPSAPFIGMVIYETDTLQSKVWNGSSWVSWANNGLVFLSSASFTTVSSVSLATNTFTSTYRHYKININITANTVDSNPLLFRGRTSGTDNSSASYSFGARGTRFDTGAAITGGYGASQTSARIGFMQSPLTQNTCQLELLAPQLASNTSFLWRGNGRGVSDPDGIMEGGGFFNGSAQFDSITFFPSSGTISGTYEVYGYVI